MKDLTKTIHELDLIVDQLKATSSLEEKYKLLCYFTQEDSKIPENFLDSLQKRIIYKALQLIGQDSHIFKNYQSAANCEQKLKSLFEKLWEVEHFYSSIGGIAGYHLTFLKIIHKKNNGSEPIHCDRPEGMNLAENDLEVKHAVRKGIELFHLLGEIYPVAGAGDRLNLKDENTKEPLPAAVLPFLGKSLIEGLILDLQAREFIHYKFTGNQAKTPLILMTSHEKNNDARIKETFQKKNWFYRSRELFCIILQPLVPMISVEGLWIIDEPLNVVLKPGGHGVIWELAEKNGALDWLLQHNRKKALVRQINNPIAGVDNGLLALAGLGCDQNKDFGFATCFRLVGAAEGIDVLIEKETEEGFEYCITNIEYTEFKHYGIQDIPCSENSKYSKYPSNTNILFIDIQTLKEVLKINPLPGQIVNLKLQSTCLDENHNKKQVTSGRVETTMQNIADHIVSKSKRKISKKEMKSLRSFVTFNRREKTISTTKKLENGDKIVETPNGAFHDYQQNARELFLECNFQIPEIPNEKAFLKNPPFIITYHPGLGPLYDIIKQKIKKGSLKLGSELHLDIAEIYIENLSLSGSLFISATHPLGHLEKNELIYSEYMGKCQLINVGVENAGINFSESNIFWKNEITRHEILHIQLEGNAEFYAKDVQFKGPYQISVPDKHRMIAEMRNHQLYFSLSKIEKPTWHWNYFFDQDDQLRISLN